MANWHACGFVVSGTRALAGNQPAPAAKLPAALPPANAPVEWGGTRWTMLLWQLIPRRTSMPARLMMHEMWHRIQPQLGLPARPGGSEHLDTVEGRYWMQLEWRAVLTGDRKGDFIPAREPKQ